MIHQSFNGAVPGRDGDEEYLKLLRSEAMGAVVKVLSLKPSAPLSGLLSRGVVSYALTREPIGSPDRSPWLAWESIADSVVELATFFRKNCCPSGVSYEVELVLRVGRLTVGVMSEIHTLSTTCLRLARHISLSPLHGVE